MAAHDGEDLMSCELQGRVESVVSMRTSGLVAGVFFM
jgi:hypothetical protein